jgi:hypothetical protein
MHTLPHLETRQSRQLLNFLGSERDRDRHGVLSDATGGLSSNEGDDVAALGEQPRQADLRGGALFCLGEGLDGGD